MTPWNIVGKKSESVITIATRWKKVLSPASVDLLGTAGQFIDQRHKGQERIISITIANKEVALMQMWIESIHWPLLKRKTIPTEPLINRKGDIDIFWFLPAYALGKAPSWKG